MLNHDPHGEKVWPRGRTGEPGFVVGTRACQMEGCRGLRLITRWPDGHKTMPCTKGMTYKNGEWEIE